MDLGKQYGPLPLGAWVAVVAGGLGIAYYSTRGRGNSPTLVNDTSGSPGVGTGGVSSWIQNTPPAGSDTVAQAPTTNEEWARLAINYLIAQGYDPALSDSTIRKYLESSPLTLAEYALSKIALAKLGSPPQPLPNPPPPPEKPAVVTPVPPDPGPGQAVPPPQNVRWVVVTKYPSQFGTLWGISKWAYGNGALYMRIYNANRRGVKRPDGTAGFMYNPNLIHPGERLYIP